MSRGTRQRILGAAAGPVAAVATLAVSSTAWAAGGPPATQLVNVADTRTIPPGLGLWLAQIYNESFVLFGGLVVVIMVAMGLVLGFGFDRALQLLGLNLGKLDHHE